MTARPSSLAATRAGKARSARASRRGGTWWDCAMPLPEQHRRFSDLAERPGGAGVRWGTFWRRRRGMQRLLMLGASGKTGGHALRYALEKGLEVVALARDPSKLEARPGLTVRKGTPASLEDVQR